MPFQAQNLTEPPPGHIERGCQGLQLCRQLASHCFKLFPLEETLANVVFLQHPDQRIFSDLLSLNSQVEDLTNETKLAVDCSVGCSLAQALDDGIL